MKLIALYYVYYFISIYLFFSAFTKKKRWQLLNDALIHSLLLVLL